MRARSIDHVSLPVRDLEVAVAFYRDVLGLEPVPRPELGIPGAWLAAGAAQVHLIATPAGMQVDVPPPTLNPAASHVAFAVDDYAAAIARVRERGLEVIETSPEAGQLWVRDPDGHVVELIAAHARR